MMAEYEVVDKSVSERVIADFDNIQQAIIEKGVFVAYGTPTSEYAGKIKEISGGSSIVTDIEAWNDDGIFEYFYINFKRKVRDITLGMAQESIGVFYNRERVPLLKIERVNSHTYRFYCYIQDMPNGINIISQGNSVIYDVDGNALVVAGIHFFVSGYPSSVRPTFAHSESPFLKLSESKLTATINCTIEYT